MMFGTLSLSRIVEAQDAERGRKLREGGQENRPLSQVFLATP